MKIRWSIVFLALFGVVAAVAAAVLTASLSAQGIQAAAPEKEKQVTILVSGRDIAAAKIVRQEDVITKVVPEQGTRDQYYTDPSQIVGRVLSLPVVAGQTFTKDDFPSEGSGLLLAAQLPVGKRAVTISLSDSSGLESLLYPGCLVDVIASFRVDGSEHIGRAVSTTLLQNIEVLGVENSTVVKKDSLTDDRAKTRASRDAMRRTLLVTLMVDSRQAEALQLATEHGAISLAMRNPGDLEVANSDATLLSEGKLAQLAELLAPKVSNDNPENESQPQAQEPAVTATPQSTPALEPLKQNLPASLLEGKMTSKQEANVRNPKFWQVDVMRGLVNEPKRFQVQD